MSAGLIAPAAIGFYRWALAGALLTPFALPGAWAQRAQILRHWPKLAVLGGLAMALYQGLAYVAASTTTATNMGIITAMIPLLTIVVSALVLRERPTLMALLGGLVSLAGLSLLLIGEGRSGRLLQVGANPGDLLMGVAALAYALYGVLLRLWACRWGRGNRCTRRSPSARCSCCRPSCWRRRRHSMPTTCLWCSTPACSVAVRAVPVDPGRASPGAEPRQHLPERDAGGHRGDRRHLPGRKPHLFHLVGGAMALAGVMLAQMRAGRPAKARRKAAEQDPSLCKSS